MQTPCPYVHVEPGCDADDPFVKVEVDPQETDDSVWLRPAVADLAREHSQMVRCLEMGLMNLRVRLITDAPDIEQHIEETFAQLLQIARER